MMWKLKNILMSEAENANSSGSGTENNNQNNSSQNNANGDSLLNNGVQPGQGAGDWLPESFRVQKETGEFDLENSAKKILESHNSLEKQVKEISNPLKSADEYAPEITADGLSFDEIKADPLGQAFLKGALEAGITNKQLSFILNEYNRNAAQLTGGGIELDREAVETELKKIWTNETVYKTNLNLAHRAFMAFADETDRARINEIGNNPIVIRMLAKVGAEMREDTPFGGADVLPEETIKSLMKSDAYMDAKHPDHEAVSNKVRRFYEYTYGTSPVV